jgi:hypothetical protein
MAAVSLRASALQKPYYNQSTEIHATLKESLTAIEPHLNFNGTANGFVPGRPVLEVPNWRERYTNTAASANSNYNAMSRLRIFSGTSNPVSKQPLLVPSCSDWASDSSCIWHVRLPSQ